jgi:serine/threonine protein kinase
MKTANKPIPAGAALSVTYTVVQHLSRGDDYDVYSVWSAARDCLCIAKVLRPDRRSDAVQREYLRREGRHLTRFSHPHIVRGYELVAGEPDIGPVVVTETLTGATLSWLIENSPQRGLDPGDAAQLGRQLCAALHYLHNHAGLVHLDVKPSNIICTAGRAILFDLERAHPPGSRRAGVGTLQYMAPEQLTHEPMDRAADVWGLGAVLYRALTGRRPFPGTIAERQNIRTTDLRRLDRPRIPSGLRHLIAGCLTIEPTGRPNLEAVRRTLDGLANSESAAERAALGR